VEREVKQHIYRCEIEWTGNDGHGTQSYASYRRDHVVHIAGKPDIPASSDPGFRGDKTRYNPEELLVASLSSCHMLWYLHLCALNKIAVREYRDSAEGVMRENVDGSGEFVSVILKPQVLIAEPDKETLACELHHKAHSLCFISRSVNFSVEVSPRIQSGDRST
jgi:organic hydroperoxide reductase OsmC/OhrA